MPNSRKKEIVMLMEKGPMQGYQRLPLFIRQLVCCLGLLLAYLDTLLFNHHEASIYALDFIDQLLL